MSGVIEGQAPMEADNFDAQWQSARAGELPAPAQEPQPTGASVESQGPEAVQPPAADPVQAPAEEFVLPTTIQEKIRQAGAKDLDELIQNSRSYQSVKGNLPQMEQQWREKYLTPVERELTQLREERRQAIEDFVKIDPQTQQVRSIQEQQQVRAALEQQESRVRAQEDQQQARAQLAADQAAVERAKESLLRQGMEGSIAPYAANLAKQHNVPVAVIKEYIDNTRLMERVRDLPDPQLFGHIIVELGKFAEEKAPKLAAQRAEAAAPKYRDIGAGAGVGGQATGQRWNAVTDAEFDQAWESSKVGNLR